MMKGTGSLSSHKTSHGNGLTSPPGGTNAGSAAPRDHASAVPRGTAGHIENGGGAHDRASAAHPLLLMCSLSGGAQGPLSRAHWDRGQVSPLFAAPRGPRGDSCGVRHSRPGPAGPPLCREGWAGRRVRRSRWLQRRYGGAPGWGSIHPRMLPGLFRNAVPSFFFFFLLFLRFTGALHSISCAPLTTRRGHGGMAPTDTPRARRMVLPPLHQTDPPRARRLCFPLHQIDPPRARRLHFPSTMAKPIRRGSGGYFFSPSTNDPSGARKLLSFPSTYDPPRARRLLLLFTYSVICDL